MRRGAWAAALAGAILSGSTALADGAAGIAFAADAAPPGEALGSAAWILFACAGAALLAFVALLAAAHGALGRCGASLDAAERSLPDEEAR